jgi:hypothetical protein
MGGVPASNFAPGGLPKIGVVVHVIVGSGVSAISEFQTDGAQLSAHFVVCGPGEPYPDGKGFQMLDTDLVAYAQMGGNWPPTAYIAIEFAGQPTNAMTDAQLHTGAQILAWASQTHGILLRGPVSHGTPGITTHCNPDGSPDPAWGNHPCPGPIRLAQVPQMIALAIGGNATPPGDDMAYQCTDPDSGGVWGTDASGALYAWYGAPYIQGANLNQHQDWHAGTCVGIAAHKGKGGAYGPVFFTNVKGSDGAPYSRYAFNRDGSI